MLKIKLLFCLLGVFICQKSFAKEKTPGELKIRQVFVLNAAQRKKLASIVKTDPEAKALLTEKLKLAKPLLATKPNPVEIIYYEGLVNTNPRRIKIVDNLQDMDRAAALFEVWQATGEDIYAQKCREYILAWAKTYKPTGNDVNENKLISLMVAYISLRPEFNEQDRKQVDSWLSAIAEAQIKNSKRHFNKGRSNRHTKRIRIIAIIGIALNRKEWLQKAWKEVREFVTAALYPDGSSYDFYHRDTLTYHASALRPLLDLALLALQDKQDLYNWQSPKGASIRRSVEFVVPYANGSKTRKEWLNTKVDLDRRRGAAGIEKYRPGRLYEPKDATRLMEEASAFDPALLPLVLKLMNSSAKRYPSWRTVLNATFVSK